MKKISSAVILFCLFFVFRISADSSGIRKNFEVNGNMVEAEFLGYMYKRFYLTGSGSNTKVRTESAYKTWDNLSASFQWQLDSEEDIGVTSMPVLSSLLYVYMQLVTSDNGIIYEMKWNVDSNNTTQKYIVLSDDQQVVWFTQLVWRIVPADSALSQDIKSTILEGAWEGEWYGDRMVILFVNNKSYWYGGWAYEGVSCKFRYNNNIFSILDDDGSVDEEWTILLNRAGNYLEVYEDTSSNRPTMASGDLGVFTRIE